MQSGVAIFIIYFVALNKKHFLMFLIKIWLLFLDG